MRVVGGKTGADGRLFAYIVWTVPGGPAEKSGLQQGDKVSTSSHDRIFTHEQNLYMIWIVSQKNFVIWNMKALCPPTHSHLTIKIQDVVFRFKFIEQFQN